MKSEELRVRQKGYSYPVRGIVKGFRLSCPHSLSQVLLGLVSGSTESGHPEISSRSREVYPTASHFRENDAATISLSNLNDRVLAFA